MKKNISYFDAKGDVIMTAYGNGIMTRQLYDNRTFLLKRTRTSSYIQTDWTFADNAGVKEDKIFAFDLMGNILQTHDKCTDCGLSATPDELTRNFSYDPLYRLLNATGRESDTQSSSVIWNDAPTAQVPNAQNSRAYTQAFQYDKLGNILKKIHTATGNSFTRRYNYQSGANKLTDIDNNQSVPTVIADFTYDTVGNQTMCQTERRYEWDYGNRLKAFYNQTGTGVEPSVYAVYLYDGGGNRTKKLVRKQGGDWESVTYIGGTFEYHKKGLEEKNYTQIANVEIRTGSFSGDVSDSVLYQMKDHLGSVGLRINHSGTTIDREEYYPFGDSSLRTFSKKRYRYCGKEKDEESGLYYYGARYYMSWACRFISIDPLAHDYMHLTPYNYAGNKPINSIDIDGMQGSTEQTSGGGNTEYSTPEGVPPNANIGDIFKDSKGNEWIFDQYENTPGGQWGQLITGVKIKDTKSKEVNSFLKFIGVGYTTEGNSTSKNAYPSLKGVTMDNFFGKAPSIGSEGKGAYYTNKKSPYYGDWMKARANHQALENFMTGYMIGSFTAPFVAVEAAPIVLQGVRLYHTTLGMNGGYAGTGLNYLSETMSSGSFNPLNHNALSYPMVFLTKGMSIEKQMLIGASGGLIEYKIGANQIDAIWNQRIETTILKVANGGISPIFGNVYGGIIRQGVGGNLIDKFNTKIQEDEK